MLACPVCTEPLRDEQRRAVCANAHSFDYARSGYLNLALRTRRVGDTAEMVRARAAFLAAGHLQQLASRVAEAAPTAGTVAELGSGTGYYLHAVRDRLGAQRAVGLDLSKAACDHAARRHEGILFVVADVEQRVPLLDASVELALSVFAPRPAGELARIVSPGGALLVAMATDDHLAALRRRLDLLGVHPDKLERLERRLAAVFTLEHVEEVAYGVELGADDVRNAVLMGPNAWHGKAALAEPVADRVSVTLALFRRN